MTDQLQIIWQPLLPAYIIWPLAIVGLLLSLFALLRRMRGSWWRTALYALLVLALLNPLLVAEQRTRAKDLALIVLDQTASMELGDRATQRAEALKALQDKIAKLGEIETVVTSASGNNASNLFAAMQAKLSEIPASRLAGAIMITDGEVHDVPDDLPTLKVPLHVLLAGRKHEIDRRVRIVKAPAYGLTGQELTVTVNVADEPSPQSERAELTLMQEDGRAASFAVPVGKDVDIPLTLAKPGNNLFVFSVPTLANELTSRNNAAALTINGIRDRLRVLLISGAPHPGERVWRNFLKGDPAVDLVHFTILRSPDKYNAVPNHELALIPFPVAELFEEKLKNFDLIIFDRFSRTDLVPPEYMSNIAKYVKDGGALLVSESTAEDSGERLAYSPLAAILPTKPTTRTLTGKILTGTFAPTVTQLGLRHPVTDRLTSNSENETAKPVWGHWLRQVEATPQNDSVTLMTGLQDKPLLVIGRNGEGRVAQFLSDQFWLWARNYDGGGPQAEMLRRLAHWLMREPELDETAFTAESEQTQEGWQIRVKLRSLQMDEANVSVTTPDQQQHTLTLKSGSQPGLLEAVTPVAATGLYRLEQAGRTIMVMVGTSDTMEYGAMTATEQRLRPIIQKTGGGLVWLQDQPNGPDLRRTDRGQTQTGWGGWFGLQRSETDRVTGSTSYPLLPVWLLLLLLLGLAMASWRREGTS